MYARWESGQKIDVAQRLMTEMLDSLKQLPNENFQLALRVYGHQKPVPPQDCNDTRLEVPFGRDNFSAIKRTLRSISPKGTTPIARSLERAAYDFPPCDRCRNIIILITDGVEACDEDPCAASRMLQKNGITLKPFVIGIGLDKNFRETFDCVGTYFDASDEKTFKEVLGIVVSQALDNTSAQINLLDGNGLPTETDVAITLYDQMSGKVAYQLVHTLNAKGRPDTIYLDPLVRYEMTVHSLPEQHLDNINISAGAHNIIGLDLPRGGLKLDIAQRNGYRDLQAIIREAGKNDILHVQDFNNRTEYLEGKYDIEILSLPRIILKSVQIDAGKTTTLRVPPPGVVNFQGSAPGYGSILLEEDNRLKWVCDLSDNQARQSLTLQPGNYQVVFRVKSSQQSIYSVSRKFSVSSGSTTMVKLF
jgi:Ca-activated chloride channel family protein